MLLATVLLSAPGTAHAFSNSFDPRPLDEPTTVLLREPLGSDFDLHVFRARLLDSLTEILKDGHYGLDRKFPPAIDILKERWLSDHDGDLHARPRWGRRGFVWLSHAEENDFAGSVTAPEPSTLLLLTGGLGALAAGRRRRR
jgi:hypothetical protein